MKRRTLMTIAPLLGTGLASRAQAAVLPPGFVWGVAASAPQTETAQGRAASIWDVFARRPGAIKDGSTPARGTEWDYRYDGDLALAADAGLRAFRFSIAWPRVQPAGSGAINQAGLDLYERMVDAMQRRRIEPFCTLFHWDLPASLPGGWLNRDTASRFADYCQIVGRRLGDRVKNFILLNEPGVVAVLGHALGRHALGLASRAAFAAATHHQNLAQGLGHAALRAALPANRRIGTAFSLQPCHPVDDQPDNARAAIRFDAAWNRNFLDPLFGRPYPEPFLPDLQQFVRSGDARTIAFTPDFLGVNYYNPMYMRATAENVLGATWGASPPGTPSTGMGWPIEPGGLREQLLQLRDLYGNPPVYITENGVSFPDPPYKGDVIADPQRIAYLRAHLQAAQSAMAEGCRVQGYFAWTLTDNWEWAEGYGPHFGLVAVDRTTMARTPRGSLLWLGNCARGNAIL